MKTLDGAATCRQIRLSAWHGDRWLLPYVRLSRRRWEAGCTAVSTSKSMSEAMSTSLQV